MGFVYLGLAIVLELLGTTFLKYTLGFTKLITFAGSSCSLHRRFLFSVPFTAVY